ncbi:uncharacterized protein METZ01_LOCUS72772, partial [marine metagenome]
VVRDFDAVTAAVGESEDVAAFLAAEYVDIVWLVLFQGGSIGKTGSARSAKGVTSRWIAIDMHNGEIKRTDP